MLLVRLKVLLMLDYSYWSQPATLLQPQPEIHKEPDTKPYLILKFLLYGCCYTSVCVSPLPLYTAVSLDVKVNAIFVSSYNISWLLLVRICSSRVNCSAWNRQQLCLCSLSLWSYCTHFSYIILANNIRNTLIEEINNLSSSLHLHSCTKTLMRYTNIDVGITWSIKKKI